MNFNPNKKVRNVLGLRIEFVMHGHLDGIPKPLTEATRQQGTKAVSKHD